MDSKLKVWDTETERKRLKNLKEARLTIRTCKNHQVLVDYIPGHVWYQWAEYPAEQCPMPTEEDAKNFALYKEKGLGLIKVHEEWNDAFELFGGDKFKPNNEEGFRKLINLAHQNGLRFIPYVSTGFYFRQSKHYNPKWETFFKGKTHFLAYTDSFSAGLSSPRSPVWRSFLLNNIEQLFDSYEIDGVYDDVGYDPLCFLDPPDEKQGQIDAFEESPSVDGSFEDLIQEAYSIVKRYQGIFTLHFFKYCHSVISAAPQFKCWDYLYLGEGIRDLEAMRKTVRYLPPFVFYIPDWRAAPVEDHKKLYALCIPYLQFPVLYHGRPITGKMRQGDKMASAEDLAVGHPETIAEHYRKHPDDYPCYSWWDSVPGNPKNLENYFHYFAYYKEMTKTGTHVFIDIQDQSLVAGRIWPGLVLSAFVNDEFTLVVANFMKETNTLILREPWLDIETGKESREWTLQPYELKLLKKK